jgi:hypothetical protein
VGTPANLQRKQFDNWSAKKRSGMGDFGSASNVVYWGDYKVDSTFLSPCILFFL